MQKIFNQEIRFKDEEGKDFPEWKEKRLGDICNLKAGKFISASEINDRNHPELFPCYGGNGIRGYVKSATHSGDFSLIGRQGAHCGNIKFANGKFYATEHAVVVTPKKYMHTKWLNYSLIRLKLNRFATGQAQPGISVSAINKIKAMIPTTLNEQEKIADILTSVDNSILNLNTQDKEPKSKRESLYPQRHRL